MELIISIIYSLIILIYILKEDELKMLFTKIKKIKEDNFFKIRYVLKNIILEKIMAFLVGKIIFGARSWVIKDLVKYPMEVELAIKWGDAAGMAVAWVIMLSVGVFIVVPIISMIIIPYGNYIWDNYLLQYENEIYLVSIIWFLISSVRIIIDIKLIQTLYRRVIAIKRKLKIIKRHLKVKK